MTVTATPPTGTRPSAPPGRDPARAVHAREPHRTAPLLSAPRARLVALAALGCYAALRWATLLAPSAAGRMLLLLALAIGAGFVTAQLARLPWPAQAPAALGVVLAWAALAIVAAGAPVSLVLDPQHWDDLAAGIRQGVEELPRVIVPYEAPDAWPRIAILLGGALLLVFGCVLAQPPGRRGVPFRDGAPFGGGTGLRFAAAVPLVACAVVPAAIMKPGHPALQGAVLFVLLAAFLWLERLPRAHVPAALALALLAGGAGIAATPALDREEPWVDVQALVEDLDRPATARFDWSQGYGPLDWPRDGREVLRVHAPRPAYWKAQNLDGFDGLRWVRAATPVPAGPTDELPPEAIEDERWRMNVSVTLGALASSDAIGAGTTLAIGGAPHAFATAGSPGTWVFQDPLEPGDGYVAQTVDPRPSQLELRGAGADYPAVLMRYRMLALPQRTAPGTPWLAGEPSVVLPLFGADEPAVAAQAAQQLAGTPYEQTYALARELAAGAGTPYELVRRVLAHLRDGFAYSEAPPRRPLPLPAFLFRDRAGYCQQFAGAAALLLRMGGVPARVAAGFTTGAADAASGEYVVRDYDAHAWIEAWFPRLGWVRFDPTPSNAPARQGIRPQGEPTSTITTPQLPRLPAQPAGGSLERDAGEVGDGASWPLVGMAALALVALALLVSRPLLRAPDGPDAVKAELERALRRTGRPPDPATTLVDLERRFHDAPDAAAYVRALRLGRYGAGDATVTARQRRALRAELARGLGVAGRLRALLALPPRWPR